MKTLKLGLLLAICLPVGIASIDVMAVNVAIHQISQEFATTIIKSQWILSAYTIGTAALLIPIGKCADKYGRRKMLLWGVFLFALASGTAAISQYIDMLIISRFFQGVATAMMMTTVISIITNLFSPIQRGPVITKWGAFLGASMALGPCIGGIMMHFFNWRAIFIINIPISCLAVILILLNIPESKDENFTQKISLTETLFLFVVLIGLVTVLSEGSHWGWASISTDSLLAITILFMVIFAIIQYLKQNSLLDFSLFRQPNFSAASSCGFISYFCIYAWLFIFGIYLQTTYQFSTLTTGFTCASFSFTFALCSHFLSKFINRLGYKKCLQLGFVTAAIAFLGMNLISVTTPIWQIVLLFALLGCAIAGTNAPSISAATQYISSHKAGIASATLFTIRWLGGSVGVVLLSAIYHHSNLSIACFSLAGIAVLGLFNATLLQQQPQVTDYV